jgi:phosphate transport system permease protein
MNIILEKSMRSIFTLCGFVAVLFVIVITLFLLFSGSSAIGEIGLFDFLFGKVWAPYDSSPSFGILPFILSSLYATFGSVLLGVPIGVMCAVFSAKMSPKGFGAVVRRSIDLLSGIPSVVYGLLGMIFVVPFVRKAFDLPDGANLFSAIIVLSAMILPNVISVSESSLKSVPNEYEEASYALGATKTETIFLVSIPAAKSGIVTSIVLGIGRCIGEAMAVMMVSGNVSNMPRLFGSVRFLTTAIASEMSYASGIGRQALFSIALVLFFFISAINLLLNFILKRGDSHE